MPTPLILINLLLWTAAIAGLILARRRVAPAWTPLVLIGLALTASTVSVPIAKEQDRQRRFADHYQAGLDEKQRGDLTAAAARFEQALSIRPGDPAAEAELAGVRRQAAADRRTQERQAGVEPSGQGGASSSLPERARPPVTRPPEPAPAPPAPAGEPSVDRPEPAPKGQPGRQPPVLAHKPSPFGITRYELDVKLDPAKGRYEATAVLLVRSRGAALPALEFALSKECKVGSTLLDGQPVPHVRKTDLLALTPAVPIADAADHRVEIRLSRAGGPLMEGGQALLSADSTYFHAESRWIPATGELDFRAPVRLRVTAPKDQVVIGPGRMVSRTVAGAQTTWVWQTEGPAAMAVLAAGRLVASESSLPATAERGKVSLACWTFPQHRARGPAMVKEMGKILRHYEERFGPYPYEKLAVVETRHFPGAYGSTSLLMVVDALFRQPALEHGRPSLEREVLAHEIAHQWWGNLMGPVGMGASWMSEAFASYASWQYDRPKAADLTRRTEEATRNYFAARARQGDQAIARSDPYLHVGATIQTTYEKGPMVLHMLRRELGDEAFMRLLRTFAAENRFRSVRIDGFRKATEKAAGRSMAEFFQQWLERDGGPVLRYRFRTDPAPGGGLQCVLSIAQADPPYRLPGLQIAMQVENEVQREQVTLFGGFETFRFPVKAPVSTILIDPDHEFLLAPPEWTP